MDEVKTIRSPDFRKSYQHLDEKVVVTVHGHPIGVWEPYALVRKSVDQAAKVKPIPVNEKEG